MKKFLVLLAVALFAIGSVGCSSQDSNGSGGSGDSSQTYTLKIGTVLNEADPMYQGFLQMQENVAERTNNEVQVQIYPNSQLGSDEDILEQAIVGAGVGVITDPGRLSHYNPDFGILGAPYLVDDYEESIKLLDTNVYQELAQTIEPDGLRILSFNFFQGTRHLFTKDKVETPEDLRGMRIRSSGSNIVSSTVSALGGNPVVLAWSEAYPALQQRVIEGVEVHYSAAVGASIPEVTGYVAKTGHFQLLTGIVISNRWFETLPAEYQAILIEESVKAGDFASNLILEKDAEFEEQLVNAGLEIVEIDLELFKASADKVYNEFPGYREMKDAIDSELGK